MELRPLARTGVQVSSFCLGAMMFGAWGNADRDESIGIIHAALDGGINFIDTADVYSAGESSRSSARRRAAADATTSSWPRSSTTRSARTPTTAASRRPSRRPAARALRPGQPAQPAQARRRRAARAARRPGGADAHPARHGLRHGAPRRHLAADRPPHH